MMLFLDNFAAAAQAVAPILLAGAVIFVGAVLVVNGGIGGLVIVELLRLRRRRSKATGCTIAELRDGDEWAKANGYGPGRLDEQAEDWIFPTAEFQTADRERVEAVLFAASVLADIDELPEVSA